MNEPVGPVVAFDGADFNAKLVGEVFVRDDFSCQVCGSEEIDPAHIEHRGIGGSRLKNYTDNIISLCRNCHDKQDGRNHLKFSQFRIEHFDPEDLDGGLIISVWDVINEQFVVDSATEGKSLHGERLWFYVRPRLETGEKYAKLRKELSDLCNITKVSTWQIIRRIYQIKEQQLYKTNGYGSLWEAVTGDMSFLQDGAWMLSQSSLTKYLKAFELVESVPPYLVSELQLENKEALLDFGAEKLYQVSRLNDPEEKAEVLKQVVEGNTQKAIIETVTEKKNDRPQPPSCRSCIHACKIKNLVFKRDLPVRNDFGELVTEVDEFKAFTRPLTLCDSFGYLITTMTTEEGEDMARKCSHYEKNE